MINAISADVMNIKMNPIGSVLVEKKTTQIISKFKDSFFLAKSSLNQFCATKVKFVTKSTKVKSLGSYHFFRNRSRKRR